MTYFVFLKLVKVGTVEVHHTTPVRAIGVSIGHLHVVNEPVLVMQGILCQGLQAVQAVLKFIPKYFDVEEGICLILSLLEIL